MTLTFASPEYFIPSIRVLGNQILILGLFGTAASEKREPQDTDNKTGQLLALELGKL